MTRRRNQQDPRCRQRNGHDLKKWITLGHVPNQSIGEIVGHVKVVGERDAAGESSNRRNNNPKTP